MPTNYVSHKFTLSDIQQRRLRQGKEITLKFSKENLTGDSQLYVTKTIKSRIEKAISQNKGATVRFSASMIKANQSGGFLASLIPAALSVVSSLQSEEDKSRVDSILDRRMAKLAGRGVNTPEYIKGIVQGITQSGTKEGEGLRLLGSGAMQGSGAVKDFFDGFLYGLNPLNWPKLIKMGVSEIDNAVKGKGVKPLSASGVKPLSAKGVKPLSAKGVKTLSAEGVRPLTGTGIKFY